MNGEKEVKINKKIKQNNENTKKFICVSSVDKI